ncbi:hypothetical protein RJT34_12378 [Clitoria ternatea]|uniref:Uncharacterized protein n=1 Tax=Clitoria ternatea TaxID=43366 RepID=A0AAN9JLX0_CLITE
MDSSQTSLTNCVYGCHRNCLTLLCFHDVLRFSYETRVYYQKLILVLLFYAILLGINCCVCGFQNKFQ